MQVGALTEAIVAARAAGKTPFFVNATAGTTVLGAFDPFRELSEVHDCTCRH
jgi:glutamate/tyrosine decarboxylase-like PLP-dependent enzyme